MIWSDGILLVSPAEYDEMKAKGLIPEPSKKERAANRKEIQEAIKALQYDGPHYNFTSKGAF